MTHDEELGRRALRRVVDRFVRANVGSNPAAKVATIVQWIMSQG
jgi:hypothetical protein